MTQVSQVNTEKAVDRFYSELQEETRSSGSSAPLFDLRKLEEWAKKNNIELDPETLGQALTRIIRRRKGKLVIISAHRNGIVLSNRPLERFPRW